MLATVFMFAAGIFVGWLACIGIGSFVAFGKGRAEFEGAALGFFLGPIGVVVEAALPTRPKDPNILGGGWGFIAYPFLTGVGSACLLFVSIAASMSSRLPEPIAAGRVVALVRPGGAGTTLVVYDRSNLWVLRNETSDSFGNYRDLVAKRGVVGVTNGTRAEVLMRESGEVKVRVLNGPQTSYIGWVDAAYAVPSKIQD